MTVFKTKNFYSQDNEEYLLEKNKDFLKWYNYQIQNGYNPFIEISNLQNIIDTLTAWYEFKYPERSLTTADKKYYFNLKKIQHFLKI